MMLVPDNPKYLLAYQIDELVVVRVEVRLGPAKGMKACFVRVEHGTFAPFEPFLISMQ